MTVISGVHQGSPSALAGARRRKTQLVQNKVVWKLPSGAPVIPQIVFNAVCDSIARFGVRKRKEYVAEVCKYWTLKREARRGAALIKRLQLPESSSELTRRNWKAISQGRKKLLGRREREKLRIAGMMRDYVEKVYFPEVPLIQPIFEKHNRLFPHQLTNSEDDCAICGEAKKKEDDLRANPYAVAAKELEDRLEKERESQTGSRTPISQ
ncbi:hypothetical protein BGX38DRAFT_1273773 [Terfezia claveryi]|nr:hypothetical protein BGX38DRAFT_1273773 [Terfezia claveryi]